MYSLMVMFFLPECGCMMQQIGCLYDYLQDCYVLYHQLIRAVQQHCLVTMVQPTWQRRQTCDNRAQVKTPSVHHCNL